jgi:NIPSNAP
MPIGDILTVASRVAATAAFPSCDRPSNLGDMKASYVLSFFCGAAVMLGFSTLSGSNAHSSQHVYELRMYHVHAGKMDALRDRFGDHTDAIFKRHNMKSVGYWVPEDAPNSQNLFIYILQHPSREEAEKNWADFQADPEWKKVKAESEANGPLVDHIDRYFMDPTSFSALQ